MSPYFPMVSNHPLCRTRRHYDVCVNYDSNSAWKLTSFPISIVYCSLELFQIVNFINIEIYLRLCYLSSILLIKN